MSQFVNYNKRGFTLPPGCKDLIDLLVPPRKRVKRIPGADVFAPLKIEKEHFPSAGMAQLDRFVGMLLHSRGEAFVIEITAQELKSPVVLYRSNADGATGIVLTTCEVPQQEALRAFFGSRGADPLVESTHEATTTLLYPLPPELAPLAALLRELLQEVYALGDDAGLEFSYHENEKAG